MFVRLLYTSSLLIFMASALIAADLVVSHEVETDVYQITDAVKIEKPPKIGIDYWPGSYKHWTSANQYNIWNRFGAFEPRVLVNWGMVEIGGPNSFVCDKNWGISGWNKWLSGYWDGAEVHVFGLKGGQFGLKRVSKMERSQAGLGIVDTYTLAADGGPALQAGDWFWLSKTALKPSPNQATHTAKGKKLGKHGQSNFAQAANMIGQTQWELVLDPCPEGGSTAAMKLTTQSFGGFQTYHTGGTDERFHKWPKGMFRWQGWLKRSTPGQVKIAFGGDRSKYDSKLASVEQVFDVGTKWQKYTFDFNPVEAFANFSSKTANYICAVPDGCELYLDNIMVHQLGYEPLAVYPGIIEKMREFQPSMMRFCSMISTRSMEASLSAGINQVQEQDNTRGEFSSEIKISSIVEALRNCDRVGTDPWIFTPGMMSLDDCDHLMEYLGAPANTGYGARRAEHGRQEPWLDAFNIIYLEIGNEQWGLNFTHCLNSKPEIYGALADMYFRRIKASPYYDPAKMKLICNGWGNQSKRGKWTERVAKSCPNADIIDVAFYFGGWDGVTVSGDSSDELYRNRMLGGPHIVEKNLIEALCIDPDLGQNMAKVLLQQTDLKESYFTYLGGGDASRTLEQDLTQIVGMIMNVPANALLSALFRKSERAQALLRDVIDLKEGEADDFKLETLLHHNNKPIISFVQKYPDIAKRMIGTLGLDEKQREAVLTVAGGGQAERPWTLYYAVVPAIKKRLIPSFITDEVLIADVHNITEDINMIAIKDNLLRQLSFGMTRLIDRESAVIIEQIRSGVIPLDRIANDSHVFAKEAAAISTTAAQVLAEQIALYQSDNLDLAKMDKETRIEVLTTLDQVLQADETTLARDAVALLQVSLDVLLADEPEKAQSLSANEGFVSGVRQRVLDKFGDAGIAAMIDDVRLAETILPLYDAQPFDPVRGRKQIANYEAGPGYQLPGPGKKPAEEEEAFGKSLALGITTLDAFMFEMERNFDYQCYFKFGFGSYWSSHTDNTSWRRNPSYEALLMVNQYTNGDMMVVDNSAVKRITIPTMETTSIDNHGKAKTSIVNGRKNVPLTKCYAFKDGKRHSILLYNRSFSETRSVQLDLPYSPSTQAELYRLSADSPVDTNRTELKVKQTKQTIADFISGYSLSLNPGEIVILTYTQQ